MKVKASDIVKAAETSKEVELDKDKKKVRRAGNKALPELKTKKRDAKASSKEESKGADADPAGPRPLMN